VPMSVKKGSSYVWRDIVMPGIGLYRIQADRSGKHVGTSKPEFGPMITEILGNVEFSYPEWCEITVKKMVDGHIAEYKALEYWKENYATAGKDTTAPNAMWRKRARGQLAKCTEAQALRKAFPELGSQPTAEEMEGKILDNEIIPAEKPNKAFESPHKPGDGAYESLSEEDQYMVDNIAINVIGLMSEGKVDGALQYIRESGVNESVDMRVALNSKFDSKIRSALKRQSQLEAIQNVPADNPEKKDETAQS
jgi:phage recombination protein Bet